MSGVSRDHLGRIRRVLSLKRRPMTRGEIYERVRIDHIHQVDAARAYLAGLGQVVAIGEPPRWTRAPRAAA